MQRETGDNQVSHAYSFQVLSNGRRQRTLSAGNFAKSKSNKPPHFHCPPISNLSYFVVSLPLSKQKSFSISQIENLLLQHPSLPLATILPARLLEMVVHTHTDTHFCIYLPFTLEITPTWLLLTPHH